MPGNFPGAVEQAREGLAVARGEVLMHLRSDCRLEPHALQRLVLRFASSPACDLLIGGTRAIDDRGEELGRYRPPALPVQEDMANLLFETSLAHLAGAAEIVVARPLLCWRRRIADLAGSFSPEYRGAFEFEYLFRLIEAGAAVEFVDDQLATFVVGGDPQSARRWHRIVNDQSEPLSARVDLLGQLQEKERKIQEMAKVIGDLREQLRALSREVAEFSASTPVADQARRDWGRDSSLLASLKRAIRYAATRGRQRK
jgi:hypothetical protein